jgi:S1-C subfamily serine protease
VVPFPLKATPKKAMAHLPDFLYIVRQGFTEMRIYSLKHLLLAAGGTLAACVLVGALVGFVIWPFPGQGQGRTPASSVETRTAGAAAGKTAEGDPAAPADSPYFQQNLAPLPAQPMSQDEKENIDIYRLLNEAVVNITSTTYGYNWFMEPVPEQGTGSGSIINQEGHILTNYHVVANAEKLTVTLADGSERDGKVVGVDPENDLAIVKIDPRGKKLATIPFGNSRDLLVGNKVLAIGNPFGLERTLTTGIVSGLGRPIKINDNYVIREMIQTDAAINPGNSGGPLLNTRGELVGINTMIYSPSGGSVGIGFAVPIDIAKRVVPDLIRLGKVERGWIDVTPVQLFPQLVDYAKLTVTQGLLVSEVAPGGLAEKAGIQGGSRAKGVRYRGNMIYLGGDVIVEVDGVAIAGISDLYAALEDSKPGDVVPVKVNRNGRVVALKVQLARRPRPTD